MSQIDDLLAATAQRYGLDPGAFRGIAQIESGLRPDAQNPKSSAGGLFQFIDSTWNQYGKGDKLDPQANADAAGRYLSDVRDHLARTLGRDPTPGELYLGHQQGAGGAAKILSNPSAPAASTVGTQAVLLNGGNQGMSNADFAGLWSKRLASAMGQPAQGGAVAARGWSPAASAKATAATAASPSAPPSAAPQGPEVNPLAVQMALQPDTPDPVEQQNKQLQATQAKRRLALLGAGELPGIASMF